MRDTYAVIQEFLSFKQNFFAFLGFWRKVAFVSLK